MQVLRGRARRESGRVFQPAFDGLRHGFRDVLRAATAAQLFYQLEQGVGGQLHGHCGSHSIFSAILFCFVIFKPR
ncbi:MAG: hypothetical protein ABIQ08_00850, partial [Duganella sp.]